MRLLLYIYMCVCVYVYTHACCKRTQKRGHTSERAPDISRSIALNPVLTFKPWGTLSIVMIHCYNAFHCNLRSVPPPQQQQFVHCMRDTVRLWCYCPLFPRSVSPTPRSVSPAPLRKPHPHSINSTPAT